MAGTSVFGHGRRAADDRRAGATGGYGNGAAAPSAE
ncbi:hypothetical protein SYYSPA8_15795 [Streptomyces yaizuensis]|uniref:Uncharacterized protein n=1 Tax=Streptomyces yaizuensis TaxID=2989713 RepID=A0ABQ5NZK0_9ACTN|nr:hypothetical protein SYYSPA8_15795 [Streptomyces sp. YSPA8]